MTDGFEQAFHEEARELLGEFEAALLELDQNRDDPEIVGRAFRALHTIKGSGAMFGFDNIAGFAHNLEGAFDRLRQGQLTATTDLINLSLAAGDQIKSMLDTAAGVGVTDEERSVHILDELSRLTGLPGSSSAKAPVTPVASAPSEAGPCREWSIQFRPGPEVILNGTNPLLLLRELRTLGDLRLKLDVTAIPTLESLDPERCCVGWDMVLSTTAGRDAIRDVFIFIEGECDLRIEAAPSVRGTASPAPAARLHGPGAASGAKEAGTSSIRVSAAKLDQLVNLVGELVTVQARLSEFSVRRDDPEVLAISEEIDRLTAELRENSMSIRMLPLRNTFERFRRLVHDLSIDLHKEAELIIDGADTELDKTVIDQLNDPLVHLVRNSMDHGIEPGDVRRAAGKTAVGTIRLSAMHAGAQVVITVSDDGRGLDAQAVRARAIERGLIDPAAHLTESEIFAFILAPGFSTAREVTDVSGRGVGLDVVRRNLEVLRGSVEISSKPGVGMTVAMRLPLTLAIIDGLLVRVAGAHFVLPLANSLECVELTRQDIQDAHGNHLAHVRGEMVPYVRLSEHFEMAAPRMEREQIMVVETEEGRYGLVVDEVLGNHQTVIKNLGRLYRDVHMMSGATILGNGTVALILDPHRLVQSAIHTNLQKKRSDGRKPVIVSHNASTERVHRIHVTHTESEEQ